MSTTRMATTHRQQDIAGRRLSGRRAGRRESQGDVEPVVTAVRGSVVMRGLDPRIPMALPGTRPVAGRGLPGQARP